MGFPLQTDATLPLLAPILANNVVTRADNASYDPSGMYLKAYNNGWLTWQPIDPDEASKWVESFGHRLRPQTGIDEINFQSSALYAIDSLSQGPTAGLSVNDNHIILSSDPMVINSGSDQIDFGDSWLSNMRGISATLATSGNANYIDLDSGGGGVMEINVATGNVLVFNIDGGGNLTVDGEDWDFSDYSLRNVATLELAPVSAAVGQGNISSTDGGIYVDISDDHLYYHSNGVGVIQLS